MDIRQFEQFVNNHQRHKDILKNVLPFQPFEIQVLRVAQNVGYTIEPSKKVGDILDDLWLHIYIKYESSIKESKPINNIKMT